MVSPPAPSGAPAPRANPPHPADEAGDERAAALVEAAPDAILGVDGDGIMRMANRQAEQVFGYSRHEMLGKPVELLIPARFAKDHAAHRQGYFSHPRTRAMGEGLPLMGRRKDGSEFPVDVSLSALETAQGRLGVAFVRDITQRKAAEEQLLQANRDLESFSHTISHDLRAPLRAMRGFSQALLEDYGGVLDATALDYLKRIDKAGASMERLVDDLLEFSRLGRREVQTGPVSLEKAMEEVLAPLADQIAQRRATVEVRHPLPEVVAEPQLLHQVLSNLLSNALKYVARGQAPHVEVWAQPAGARVRIMVQDHGIGIEAEHMERIWKPFERLHGPEEYAGTGVGLAIAKRAVERMGGSAGAQSEVGKGSLFWIELSTAKGGRP